MTAMKSIPLFSLVLLQASLALHTGCNDDTVDDTDADTSADTDQDTDAVATPASVEVSPAELTLNAIGQTATVTATVFDAESTPIPNATVSWASSDDGIATISESGEVTAVDYGSATITANADGVDGVSATTSVEVKDPRAALDEGLAIYASFDDGWRFEGSLGSSFNSSPKPKTTTGVIGKAMANNACFTHPKDIAWSGSKQIAFSFWVNPKEPKDGYWVKGQLSAIDWGAFQLKMNETSTTFQVYSSTRAAFNFNVDFNLADTWGSWAHVAFSLDLEKQEVRAWVNGESVAISDTSGTTPPATFPESLQEKTQPGKNNWFKLGAMNCDAPIYNEAAAVDEYRVYNRALTQADVDLLYSKE